MTDTQADGGPYRPDPTQPMLAHFYRALVAHMDVWRQRMDATTNWAAATTAAMVTFSFSTSQTPHFVLLLALGFNFTFLLMESRRYQIFDLWRRRFRLLNRYLVHPVLAGPDTVDAEEQRQALARVGADLGRMVPHLSLFDAVGYRIRRNYAYLFLVTLLAWVLKLEVHPDDAQTLGELVLRAEVGQIPGAMTMAVVGVIILTATVLAIRAPSEQMLQWSAVPSPYRRWLAMRRGKKRDV